METKTKTALGIVIVVSIIIIILLIVYWDDWFKSENNNGGLDGGEDDQDDNQNDNQDDNQDNNQDDGDNENGDNENGDNENGDNENSSFSPTSLQWGEYTGIGETSISSWLKIVNETGRIIKAKYNENLAHTSTNITITAAVQKMREKGYDAFFYDRMKFIAVFIEKNKFHPKNMVLDNSERYEIYFDMRTMWRKMFYPDLESEDTYEPLENQFFLLPGCEFWVGDSDPNRGGSIDPLSDYVYNGFVLEQYKNSDVSYKTKQTLSEACSFCEEKSFTSFDFKITDKKNMIGTAFFYRTQLCSNRVSTEDDSSRYTRYYDNYLSYIQPNPDYIHVENRNVIRRHNPYFTIPVFEELFVKTPMASNRGQCSYRSWDYASIWGWDKVSNSEIYKYQNPTYPQSLFTFLYAFLETANGSTMTADKIPFYSAYWHDLTGGKSIVISESSVDYNEMRACHSMKSKHEWGYHNSGTSDKILYSLRYRYDNADTRYNFPDTYQDELATWKRRKWTNSMDSTLEKEIQALVKNTFQPIIYRLRTTTRSNTSLTEPKIVEILIHIMYPGLLES